MFIKYDESNRIFHLQSGEASYVLGVTKQGYLAHYYWGRKVRGTALNQLLELKERRHSLASTKSPWVESPALGPAMLVPPCPQPPALIRLRFASASRRHLPVNHLL